MGIAAPTPEKTPGAQCGLATNVINTQVKLHPMPLPRHGEVGVPKFIPLPSSFLCQYKYGRPRSGLGLLQCLECICETSQRAQTFHHKIQMSDILCDRRQGRTPGARYPGDRRRPALTPGNLSQLELERSIGAPTL